MKGYRDYLDRQGVPRGPWCTNVNDENIKRKLEDGMSDLSGSSRVVSLEAGKRKRKDNG